MNPSRSEGAAQLAGCNPKPEPEPVTNWTNQDSLNKTTLTHSAPQTQARARTRARISRLRIPFFLFFLFFCPIFFFLSFSLFIPFFLYIHWYPYVYTTYYCVCSMPFFFIHCFQCSEGGLHIRFWVCTFVRCILYYIPCNSGRCVMYSL